MLLFCYYIIMELNINKSSGKNVVCYSNKEIFNAGKNECKIVPIGNNYSAIIIQYAFGKRFFAFNEKTCEMHLRSPQHLYKLGHMTHKQFKAAIY